MLKDKIRVLHILSSLTIGGAEVNLLELIKHLDSNKIESHIVYTAGGEYESEFLSLGVPCHKIQKSPLNLRSPVSWIMPIKLIKYAYSNKIDIIHAHLFLSCFWAIFVAKILKIPLVYHLHSISPLFHPEDSHRQKAHPVLEKILLKQISMNIAITKTMFRRLQQLGINSNKVTLIHNGIDTAKFKEDLSQNIKRKFHLENKLLIGTVSRLDLQKNIQLLLKCVPEIRKKFQNIKFLIVGLGSLDEELKQLAKSLFIEDDVIFLGARTDISDILQAIDIFVLPSLYENFPMALLEAMCARKAIIATKVGGIAEMIDNGKEGILIPPDNKEELIGSLKELIPDSKRRLELGRAAYQKVSGQFSSKVTVRKIEEIYKQVLENRL